WKAPLRLDHLLYGLVMVAEAAALGAAVAACLSPDQSREYLGPVPVSVRLLRSATLFGALVIGIAGAWWLVAHLWRMLQRPADIVRCTRYTQRALQIDSGVSPLMPIALLTVPILGWSLLQLWRVGGPRLDVILETPW